MRQMPHPAVTAGFVPPAKALGKRRPDHAAGVESLRRAMNHYLSYPSSADILDDVDLMTESLQRRTPILSEDRVPAHIYVLQSGWAVRYKLLPDGRRQIVDFVVPGDIIGLRSLFLGRPDHCVETLTEATVTLLPRQQMIEAFRQPSKLGEMLLCSIAHRQSLLLERVVHVGQLTAYERIAHLFLELLRRLQIAGVVHGSSFACPLTQELLADATGLSIVHVNRTLRKLREDGLVTVTRGRINIHDVEELATAVGFDGSYLEARTWRGDALFGSSIGGMVPRAVASPA